jgi:hypothetical protein
VNGDGEINTLLLSNFPHCCKFLFLITFSSKLVCIFCQSDFDDFSIDILSFTLLLRL